MCYLCKIIYKFHVSFIQVVNENTSAYYLAYEFISIKLNLNLSKVTDVFLWNNTSNGAMFGITFLLDF